MKKKRNLIEDYQGSTQQNSSTDREIGSTRGRGRGDGTKIGPDRNIPRNKES